MNALLAEAVTALADLVIGETFRLKDLFRGFQFNRLSKTQRVQLGWLFSEKMQTDYKDSIEIVREKHTGGSTTSYRKIK